MNPYLIAIIVYACILVAVGFIATKGVKGASDFFVAGRRLGPALLFTTLIAPNIGAGSTVGVAGVGYKFGISAWWWIASSAVGSVILAFIVGPAIWRVAKEYNLYTLGDYLDYRYNRNFRGFISLMMAIGTLAIFAGQLMGIAWILTAVAGTGKTAGILVGSIVVILYFGAGGLLAATFVNSIQIVVKFVGFLLAVPFALHYIGGWEGLTALIGQNIADANKAEAYMSFDGIGITMIIGYFLMLTPSFFISPGLIGKVYGARDVATVRIGTALNALVQFAFAIVPVILGMCAFAAFPNLSQSELALPIVMKEFMPFWASAFALAAIFSAEVSAADAVLYMITTSFTKDLYKTFIKPETSDEELLKMSRIVTVAAGILGISIALLLPNIITALSIFYSLMSVSLTAPLLFGLFSRRPSTKAAFICAIAGVLTTVVLQFGNDGKGIGILNAQSTGIVLTIIIMVFMMVVFPAKEKGVMAK
ncbi:MULTISPECIES: sodium:solute symporter family protein [Pelosinus]|uniref:Na+/solute symporter n=1 Tax=Pelosinus fermentans B4 TaxID=1149862 RepID=I8RIQ4_9FIRM|nr:MULTISPECIES: sodium:solute symporter family protein [Pelosinus]EIW17965.1 Na+/solute symporter [Pelosinus fermentans B4]EIW23927.1 Na+/solute symporter [Pelosinus fermentans A11]OAM94850.1 Na+/solute symporter [Pelosinus fermentans DSM 17108]SDR18930.1 solute:Na+ symporter, SSS family [Pelosinus fermentans]